MEKGIQQWTLTENAWGSVSIELLTSGARECSILDRIRAQLGANGRTTASYLRDCKPIFALIDSLAVTSTPTSHLVYIIWSFSSFFSLISLIKWMITEGNWGSMSDSQHFTIWFPSSTSELFHEKIGK